MKELLHRLLRDNDLCVLCTCGDRPLASLMSCIVEPDKPTLYMTMSKESHKYKNILKNAAVSVLMDNRAQTASPDERCALTIAGRAEAVTHPDICTALAARLMRRNPQLAPFLQVPGGVILAIHIESCQVLRGVHESVVFARDAIWPPSPAA